MEVGIITQRDLKSYNTFGVQAKAAYFVAITREEQLQSLLVQKDLPAKRLVLGGGSNILFTQDFDGLVIKVDIPGIQHKISGTDVLVTAGGGVVWNDLVRHCVMQGFWGIENLTLIPGTVGASPVQNIGAYGTELMDVFRSCRAFDTQISEFVTLNTSDCQFSYRDSVFKNQAKGRYIITEVTLSLSTIGKPNTSYGAIQEELTKRNITKPSIQDVAEVVSLIRVSKLPDPSTIGNAGSFFKNPVISPPEFETLKLEWPDMVHYIMLDGRIKLSAGWLIEKAGWRGKSHGDCGTWKNQALVLVNHGNASGKDLYDFSEAIIADVRSKFGVSLEREVNIF